MVAGVEGRRRILEYSLCPSLVRSKDFSGDCDQLSPEACTAREEAGGGRKAMDWEARGAIS